MYYIIKKSRDTATPYQGPAWWDDTPREFASLAEARKWAAILTQRNPAGFQVKSR